MDSNSRISKEEIERLNKMTEQEHADEFEQATKMQNDLLKAIRNVGKFKCPQNKQQTAKR